MPAVAISWTPSTDPTVTGYRIRAALSSGAPSFLASHYTYDGASVGCDTSPKNVGLVSFAYFKVPDDANTYYFIVTAVAGSDESPNAASEVVYPIGGGGGPAPPNGTLTLTLRQA